MVSYRSTSNRHHAAPDDNSTRQFAILSFPDLGSSNLTALRQARTELFLALEHAHEGIFEVDLQCAVAGASFVGILVEAAKYAHSKGAKLVLRSVDNHVTQLVHLCGYSHLIATDPGTASTARGINLMSVAL